MSVDWITVAAQLANFLVLVWLLKRFLYRPILEGIDAREAEIADRMQVAVRAKEEAEATKENYETQLSALRSEQASAADAMRQQAEDERDTLLANAHARIEAERAAWQVHRNEEAQSFTNKLHGAAGQALLELTRKALLDLADDSLEVRIASQLAERIGSMDGALQHAAGDPNEAIVTSHMVLPDAVKSQLAHAVQNRFPGVEIRFETKVAQAPGLSLQIGGAHLEWGIETYIEGLNTLIAEKLATAPTLRTVAG